MEGRRLIESLVPEIAPNASIVGIEERERYYTVTIAGTTGVLAGCELPRETVDGRARGGCAPAGGRRTQALHRRRGG
jgi:hypothetical protein